MRAVGWRIGLEDENRWVTSTVIGSMLFVVVLVVIGGSPIDLPMPTHAFGWVEPTCGLTRGSTALLRGDLGLAWKYNPASFLLVGGAFVWIVRTVVGWSTRCWLNLTVRPTTLSVAVIAIGSGLLWRVQQSNAEFIIASRA